MGTVEFYSYDNIIFKKVLYNERLFFWIERDDTPPEVEVLGWEHSGILIEVIVNGKR